MVFGIFQIWKFVKGVDSKIVVCHLSLQLAHNLAQPFAFTLAGGILVELESAHQDSEYRALLT